MREIVSTTLLDLLVGLVFLAVVSCGPTPMPTCNVIEKERCFDEDGDGTAEVVQICDGENWEDNMDCSEQWDADGNPVNDKCVMDDDEAICVQR